MLINLSKKKKKSSNVQVFNSNSFHWMRNLGYEVCLFKKKTLLLNEPLMTLLNFFPIIFIAIFREALTLVCRFLPWTAFSASGCFTEKKRKNLNCWKIVQVENKLNQTRPWKCLLLTAYSLSQNIALSNMDVKQILMIHYMTSIQSFKEHRRS